MLIKKIINLLAVVHCSFGIGYDSLALNSTCHQYENDLLSKEFHQGRRQALREKMPENSAAILFANPERNRSNDVEYQYHQDPNFYYLTGFLEGNSLIVIFKSPQTINGITSDEFLFVPDRDLSAEMWTGRRLGKEGAMTLTGIRGVFLASEFDSVDIDFKKFSKILYIIPKGAVDEINASDDLYDLIVSFKSKAFYPPANGDTKALSSAMAELREIKTPEEIKIIRKAVEISCKAHDEIIRAIKPGMFEYDAQAIGEYVFKHHGSEYIGYPSICGNGENACILHYTSNRSALKEGSLQLNDMGAEYHGYTADVTRTFPVSGKFSPEQKAIYEIVLSAQEAGINACQPGNEFNDPHRAATEVIKKGLLDLGIIKSERDYRRYFAHGTSHYLGLDVHDAGTRQKLKAGVILTVEPGIYIPEGSPCDPQWWNIGIRIEDDILITENGHENLSASSPRTIEAIESLMKEKPIYVKEVK